ncbi:MAG TPA: flagellar hook-length control protein FliK [Spirochaetota bacterium]|nr:flagellar hook-length control protein FliK [Spirochaetota bacterium]HOR45125.1 flagellar hook-length control protein FliK [Spirochaetota bacterium]HOU84178.1 flagellar hook-length control protein FliK [Spirochaetota bacterium]HPK56759.1 flagellar hook-length control protein FliK [Spirochaetota bacterium]HQE59314.1 flagellar hook-length control protein FliK [Spirochaetota bacterium]
MINFSEILKSRRSEELPEPKNTEKGNDAFASLFAESVKNASDNLKNIAEKDPKDTSGENNLIEAKNDKLEINETDKYDTLTEDKVIKNKHDEIEALPVQKEDNVLSSDNADLKKIKIINKKENKTASKTEKENGPADPIAETLKTANNAILSILNKSQLQKSPDSNISHSENIKSGARASNTLSKNIFNNQNGIISGLPDKKASDKNGNIISDFLKDKKFISKEKVKDTEIKSYQAKDFTLNELESKHKSRINNKSDHVKTAKAAENSAAVEVSKKNDINLNVKITEELNTVTSLSSSNKKETSDGNFFSFDKNSSNIRNDREFKAEINTASKTPFSDQLKEILNNSRINVRNDKNADITIKMNPENLGDMRVKMEMENGIIKANFTVATEEAKELLLLNIEELKNSLSSGGISIGEMKVSVKNENNGENRHFVPEKNIMPDIKETTAVYSADSLYYDGHLNLVV